MQYRIRRIQGDGETIGAFASIDGYIDAVLLRDYFFEIPRHRKWKHIAILEAATENDLESEIIEAHKIIHVDPVEETDNLTLPPALTNCSMETGIRIAAQIAIKNWLRSG
ncbi:MAG: hypothetical protein Q8O38_01670 [Sulfurimicrobium sp.]|nr:hypothetical protein [Sulfurimicrobium sp.]